MPQLTDRIFHFGVRFGQGDVETLVKRVEAAFVVPMETVATWIAVEGETVVGHLLAVEDEWAGEKVGFLIQAGIDTRRMPRRLGEMAQQELEAWARSHGYRKVLALTRHWTPRAWKARYGFKLFRFLLVKELDEP